jgi:catechol 2,3-dioxygenase-like lactoylglutathione lyase family enzyme
MALHQLKSVTIGVPDVAPVASYYEEFGLTPLEDGHFATTEGGRQLQLVAAPTRRLVEMCVGVDDGDDLARVDQRLTHAGIASSIDGERLVTTEPSSGVRVVLEIASRQVAPQIAATTYNGPGVPTRLNERAQGILRTAPVRPRKLGHCVIGSANLAATSSFFSDTIGFKVSDYADEIGVFLRCSTDHHNLLILAAPVSFLHHTAWQVDDVDEIGRGANALLEGHPERHVWGLGRHHAGSNFFWYLCDPAGNFTEYYSDLDVITEDAAWIPEQHLGPRGLYNWGPPPSAQFLQPDDLMELAHKQQSVGV